MSEVISECHQAVVEDVTNFYNGIAVKECICPVCKQAVSPVNGNVLYGPAAEAFLPVEARAPKPIAPMTPYDITAPMCSLLIGAKTNTIQERESKNQIRRYHGLALLPVECTHCKGTGVEPCVDPGDFDYRRNALTKDVKLSDSEPFFVKRVYSEKAKKTMMAAAKARHPELVELYERNK